MPRQSVAMNCVATRTTTQNDGSPPPITESVITQLNGVRWTCDKPVSSRRKRPNGWLYPTPYNTEVFSQTGCIGSYRHEIGSVTGGRKIYVDGNLGQGWTGSVAVLPHAGELLQPCETKALLKLKDQKVNLGVALAEAQQTANFVGSAAARYAQTYQAFRRGQFKRAWSQATGISSHRSVPKRWLEYQYALNPLLQDVKGSFDALKQHPSYDWVVTAKASMRIPVELDETKTNLIGSYGNIRRTEVGFKGCFVRLDFQPGNTFLSSLSQVGVTNPLEIIWEKVPFSFVVDWFLPIGDWLSAMDATYGWQFLSGSRSFLTRSRVTFRSAGTTRPSEMTMFSCQGSGKTLNLSRLVYLTSPLPSFPGIKNPVSLGHMANGLSLLSQVFGRGH